MLPRSYLAETKVKSAVPAARSYGQTPNSSMIRTFGARYTRIRRSSKFCLRPSQVFEQVESADKVDAEALPDRLDPEPYREMRLAHAWRPKQDHVSGVRDEAESRQLLDLPLVSRRLELEVKVVEPAMEPEVGKLRAGREVALASCLRLHAKQVGQILRVRDLLAAGLLDGDHDAAAAPARSSVLLDRSPLQVDVEDLDPGRLLWRPLIGLFESGRLPRRRETPPGFIPRGCTASGSSRSQSSTLSSGV